MTQRSYLNLGAGRISLPQTSKPAHWGLIPDAVTRYPLFVNVDRNPQPGINCVVDLFSYPWNLPSDSFDGAIAAHLVEHIPHEIRLSDYGTDFKRSIEENDDYITPRAAELRKCQDGWFAWWAELYRVLTPGAIVHVLSPYATSAGFLGDPSHTRPITEQTLLHSMRPNPDAPFEYATGGIHFELVGSPSYAIEPEFAHLIDKPERLAYAVRHQWNVVTEMYMALECVK